MWNGKKFETKEINIVITNEHFSHTGEWIMFCEELGISRMPLELPESTPLQEARRKSLFIVKHHLRMMLSTVNENLK
ncbi:MAG: hypothetical protein ACWA44_02380 [Thiotrichales bacterium]